MEVRLACSRWKGKVTGYVKYVDREVTEAGEIVSVEVGRALLDLFEEKWERHTDAYAKLEADFPDPSDLGEEEDPLRLEPYRDRKEQLAHA